MLRVEWKPREPPLSAVAVAAVGTIARALAQRVLRLPDEHLAALEGVAGRDVIVLVGRDLPWVEGVEYLGVDALAPSLLLSATHTTDVHPALHEAVVARMRLAPPIALVDRKLVVSLAAARPITRSRIEQWLEAGSS